MARSVRFSGIEAEVERGTAARGFTRSEVAYSSIRAPHL